MDHLRKQLPHESDEHYMRYLNDGIAYYQTMIEAYYEYIEILKQKLSLLEQGKGGDHEKM